MTLLLAPQTSRLCPEGFAGRNLEWSCPFACDRSAGLRSKARFVYGPQSEGITAAGCEGGHHVQYTNREIFMRSRFLFAPSTSAKATDVFGKAQFWFSQCDRLAIESFRKGTNEVPTCQHVQNVRSKRRFVEKNKDQLPALKRFQKRCPFFEDSRSNWRQLSRKVRQDSLQPRGLV